MIRIQLSRNDFEYDIRSLLKAFYPKEEICLSGGKKDDGENRGLFFQFQYSDTKLKITVSDEKGEAVCESTDIFAGDKKASKNSVKRLLYRILSRLTGRELPWGTLTGIRPVKIPLAKLENGEPEEEIYRYMKEQFLCMDGKIALSLEIAKRELGILNELDYKNGYSVYIGIPFCPSTCLYCSFTSYSFEKFSGLVNPYMDALFKEIDYASGCMGSRKLTTVYIGGGTPTTLSAYQLGRLLDKIKESFDFTYVKEFTVEAGRPDSITVEKLKLLKEKGVTRISINPQTMKQETLRIIGRKHTVEQIETAFQSARECGHDNINMDLIIGLPGETTDDIKRTLEKIDALKPDNLTVHTLAVKRAANLNIYREKYSGYQLTGAAAMFAIAQKYTRDAGYFPYYLYRQKNMTDNLENVGYAKNGKEGIYNILIMEERQPIIALGAGSSSKFILENGVGRVENVKSVNDYIGRIEEMIERKKKFISENY